MVDLAVQGGHVARQGLHPRRQRRPMGLEHRQPRRQRPVAPGAQAAACLLALYDSDCAVGLVDREDFTFRLLGPRLPYAGASARNQRAL